jgi:atrial natriuretic peptide receptor B
MAFLHKSLIQSHGRLTSAECYINNRWVLKVGGFGLNAFREEPTVDEVAQELFAV